MDELKTQMRWVCFDKDKTPINPYTGSFASSTDPKTWTTYAQAKSAAQRFRAAGVGFVFNGDGIVGIDLDDCLERISVDENGRASYDRTHFAKYIMEHGISYAEVSPSKTGIHIIGTAKISKAIKTKLHDIGVEVYSTARYFTYTEDFVGGVELPLGDIRHGQGNRRRHHRTRHWHVGYHAPRYASRYSTDKQRVDIRSAQKSHGDGR